MPALFAIFYIIYTMVFELLASGVPGVIRNIQLYIVLFFVLVGESRRKRIASLNNVFWVIIGLYAVWIPVNLRFLIADNARAMRVVVRSSAEAMELMSQGVGGYALVYGVVLLLPVLVTLTIKPDLIPSLKMPFSLSFFKKFPRFIFFLLDVHFYSACFAFSVFNRCSGDDCIIAFDGFVEED